MEYLASTARSRCGHVSEISLDFRSRAAETEALASIAFAGHSLYALRHIAGSHRLEERRSIESYIMRLYGKGGSLPVNSREPLLDYSDLSHNVSDSSQSL